MRITILLMGLFLALSAQAQENVQYVQDPVTESISYTKIHENGQVAETGSFNSDHKQHGKFVRYDSEGNVLTVAYYKNGLKHGTWKHWHGDTYTEVIYHKNVIIKAVEERTFIASND